MKDELLEPGVIWDKTPGRSQDLRSLLSRATQRLGERRLFIIVDQFEEFLSSPVRTGRIAFSRFLAISQLMASPSSSFTGPSTRVSSRTDRGPN